MRTKHKIEIASVSFDDAKRSCERNEWAKQQLNAIIRAGVRRLCSMVDSHLLNNIFE